MGTDGFTHPLFTKQHQALREALGRIEDEVERIRINMEDDYWGYGPGTDSFKEEVMLLFEQAARLLQLHNRAAEIRPAMEKLAKSPVGVDSAEML